MTDQTSSEDAARAEKVIAKLSDPHAVKPWMLAPDTDDYVRDGFAPRGVDLRDFCLIWKDGRCHFFYHDMRLKQNSRTYGQGIMISHAATDNFVDWEVYGGLFLPDEGHWDGRAAWAPNIVEHDGAYYMFYTGLNYKLAQSIGIAVSNDLMRFDRYPGNPVMVPGFFDWCLWSREGLSNCRDPHIFVKDNKFYLYYTALCKTGEVCVAAAESENLFDWQDCGPVVRFLPERIDSSPLCLESAFVHEHRGRYVLSYSHDGAVWLNYSDDHLSFNHCDSFRVWEGHLAIEKVMELHSNPDVWLVCAFNQVSKERPSRLYFGVLDLSADAPQVERVRSREDMARLLGRT